MGGRTVILKKLAAISLAASFLLIGRADAEPLGAQPGCEIVNVLAFHVEAKPDKPVYVVGEKATIHVTVTRPAREDPAGQGVELDPPESEPAEGINVGIAIMSGNTWTFGFEVTDAKGKTDVKIPIEPHLKGGEVTANVYAWRDTVQTACLTVREYGYRRYEKFFRVVNP